ncbi:hypothetical protein ASG63_08430 [Methylobacterium sp. Leaf94]|uniref:hypothetical protein n=1 Tax=Methylobacterium sp. Leaf94 TaxID=1736250 RepID=UPI0006F95631|nr:hypothetical protein [Methylobacterium sp. Leaf94]KQU17527.1 hypothetical protein ASG63_08430 [Methylobacterium sp. Leaf94]
MSETTRADERAEEELELKRQGLQLERDKFRFDKVLKFRERLVLSVHRIATAIVLANASALVFSLTYYKQLIDVVGKPNLGYSTTLFLIGLAFAAVAFLDATSMSHGDIDLTKASADVSGRATAWFGFHAIVSAICLFVGVCLPVSELWVPPDLTRLQEWSKSIGAKP